MTRSLPQLSRLRPLARASFQVHQRRGCCTASCIAVPLNLHLARHVDLGTTSRSRKPGYSTYKATHRSLLISHSLPSQQKAEFGLSRSRGYATDEHAKQQASDVESTPSKAPLIDRVKSNVAKLKTHENIYTLPNILTVSRLIAAPIVGYLVVKEQHAWAVGLFAYAGITDLVDGWIARRWKLQTVVGSVIDPGADKLLMIVLVGCLAFKGALPREQCYTRVSLRASYANVFSVARNHHNGPRCLSRHRGDLLPICFAA